MAPVLLPAGNEISFGHAYAVLNLDMMQILIDSIRDTTLGEEFVANCSRWNSAVHEKVPRPLSVFTTLAFSTHSQPELAPDSRFSRLIEGYGSFINGSQEVRIHRDILTDEVDIILPKTRWYAGSGNSLEQVLKAQNIKTVIISGLTLSGAVMSTIYRLFDLDYDIYVIVDNVLDLPPQRPRVFLDYMLSKINVSAISIDEALKALHQA